MSKGLAFLLDIVYIMLTTYKMDCGLTDKLKTCDCDITSHIMF